MSFKECAKSLLIGAVAASSLTAPANARSASEGFTVENPSRVCWDLNGSPQIYYQAKINGIKYDIIASNIVNAPYSKTAYIMAGTNGIYFQAQVNPYSFPGTSPGEGVPVIQNIYTQSRFGAPEISRKIQYKILESFARVAIDDIYHGLTLRLCNPREIPDARYNMAYSASPYP